MARLFVFLLILLPLFLFGQETQKINDKKNSEVYYVLKSDPSVKHGNYQKLNYKKLVLINGYYKKGLKDSIWLEYCWGEGPLEMVGFYKNGMKEGEWLEYYCFGNELMIKGSYLNDAQIGLWEFYNSNGQLLQKYDYSIRELVFNKLENSTEEKTFKIITDADTIETILDRPPVYIGGIAILRHSLAKYIRYPGEARENAAEGDVVITFIVHKDGTTSQISGQ